MKVYNEVLDERIEIGYPIRKIVSLDPPTTETLFILGLGGKVIATDAFSYRPPEAKMTKKIGSYTHVDLEFLRQTRPDVIFTTVGAQKDLTKKLIAEGFPVYPMPIPTSVSKILDNVILVGEVTGEKKPSRELYVKLMNSIQISINKRIKVYVEFDLGGAITPGFPTHVSDGIFLAGGENIFDDKEEAYFTPDPIEVISRSPDIVIFEPKRNTPEERTRLLTKAEERGLQEILRKSKVLFTVGDFLAHMGPSFITEGMTWLKSSISSFSY
ncbi:ABC transporter substrate-binding protein [Candidatus Acidianus copahuensis]|uniref:ABC transporter substrate-binding protein n=1 Tax=Acidianus TaxID=12914 RepID=UPI000AF533AF|nr:ABC transporter substrate-binding protein [Candidatus Acidianus copahuensis]